MSGKRSLKKQQKRQASTLAHLEELYRRGTDTAGRADEELLAEAAEIGAEVAASPFAAKWAEVADRALLRSLARADLGRLDRLLRSLRRNGPLRPLAVLAKAVLDLAAGRLDEARSGLAGLAGITGAAGNTGEIAGVPSGLLTDLTALAREEPDRPRRDDPYRRAEAELFASLQALEAPAFAPTTADRQTLVRCLLTLRRLASPDTLENAVDLECRRLLDGAERCLALLTDLDGLETELSEKDGEPARQAILGWLRRSGPALAATLAAAVPPLLAPLRHAVATRWRSLLLGMAERQGSSGLAALWIADPKLLSLHVDLPGGTQGVRQRAQAEEFLEQGRHGELADLLRSRSRTASEAGDVAALWSLELWARGRFALDEEEPEDFLDPDLTELPPRRTLVRLEEMAGEIGRRFPADQRAAVARVLSAELLDLCDEVGFCEHTAGAAVSLLEHPPGDRVDFGLLLAGVAGALSAGAPRALRALQAHIDRGAKMTAGDAPTARRLLARSSQEGPFTLARILHAVKPLFADETWPEMAELVSQEMGGCYVMFLEAVSFESLRSPRAGEQLFQEAKNGLAALRPVLGTTKGFAAAELALDCWQPSRIPMAERLESFLATFTDWEAPLAAFRILGKLQNPGSPEGLNAAVVNLANTVIDRLDDRWPLWSPTAPPLAFLADPAHFDLLKERMRQILSTPETRGENRERLEVCMEAIHEIEDLRDDLVDRPRKRARGTKSAKRKKKPRRRSGHVPQLGLDF